MAAPLVKTVITNSVDSNLASDEQLYDLFEWQSPEGEDLSSVLNALAEPDTEGSIRLTLEEVRDFALKHIDRLYGELREDEPEIADRSKYSSDPTADNVLYDPDLTVNPFRVMKGVNGASGSDNPCWGLVAFKTVTFDAENCEIVQ